MKEEKREFDFLLFPAVLFTLLVMAFVWSNSKDPGASLMATFLFVAVVGTVCFWGYYLGEYACRNKIKGHPGGEEDLCANEVYENLGHVEISGKIIAFLRARDDNDSMHAYVVHEVPPKVFEVRRAGGDGAIWFLGR